MVVLLYPHKDLPSESSQKLGVDKLATQIRDELEQMEAEKADEPLFSLKGFDLEISFVVTRDSRDKGGFDTRVLTLGTEREISQEAVQKVTLHMEPLPPRHVVIGASEDDIHPEDSTNIVQLPPSKKAAR
jgi:hypothetical protein